MNNIKKTLSTSLLLFLFTAYSCLPLSYVKAEDSPNREAMANEISQQATTETSTINATPAPAASTEVTNTGDNNSTETSSDKSSETTVNNSNNTEVNQNVNATANTGNNEASRNISIGGNAGNITTGDATVNTTAQVAAGSNTTQVSGGSAGNGGAATNVINTGDNNSTSTNTASNTKTLVNNDNTTIVAQEVNANANTGNNKADRNISIGGTSGVIKTGNASVNTGMLVTAGGNVTLVGGIDNGNGPGSGASIVLANTGDDNRFSTNANNTNYVIVTNENRAYITQICGVPPGSSQLLYDLSGCSANTGGNTSNRGIGMGSDAGIIQTGDATVDVNLNVAGNSNTTGVSTDNNSNSSGSNSEVTNTGDNNSAATNSNNNTNVIVNNKNYTQVNQLIYAEANTGNNTVDRNISIGGDAGVIETGDASVNVGLNVQGDSNRTLISPAQSYGGGTGSATQFLINSGDGLDSNTASDTNNTTTINNYNLTYLFQKIGIFANTGNNSSENNIGGSNQQTGNAQINVNLNFLGGSNTTSLASNTIPTTQTQQQVTQTVTPTPTQQVAETTQTSDQQESTPANSPQYYYYYPWYYPTTNGTLRNTGNNTQYSGGVNTTNRGSANANSQTATGSNNNAMVLGASTMPITQTRELFPFLLQSGLMIGLGYSIRSFQKKVKSN